MPPRMGSGREANRAVNFPTEPSRTMMRAPNWTTRLLPTCRRQEGGEWKREEERRRKERGGEERGGERRERMRRERREERSMREEEREEMTDDREEKEKRKEGGERRRGERLIDCLYFEYVSNKNKVKIVVDEYIKQKQTATDTLATNGVGGSKKRI